MALSAAAAHTDVAGVLIDDAFADPEAEAGTGDLFGGLEGLEEVLKNAGADAFAGVGDGEASAWAAVSAGLRTDPDQEPATGVHGLNGVAYEVIDDLANLSFQAADPGGGNNAQIGR